MTAATFRERAGVGGRTFGRNLHLAAPRVRRVVSELTGVPIGRVVEHGDGRVDVSVRNEACVTVTAEEVHGTWREARAWLYDWLRSAGMTHSEAVRRMAR